MKKNIIEKSNVLNTMQQTNYDMSLNEFRFFCMYLSKLNAREPEKRTVVIAIKDFEELFNISFNTSRFKQKIRQIAGANIEIKTDKRTEIIQLYSKFAWVDDETCTDIEITCNSDIQPYIFELQKNYTSYRLENIAKLNSVSKIRLYELMKQYENIKCIQFDVEDLKKMLMSNETNFKFFKLRVIEPAIKDINEYTDITVTYEKVLKCRKCVAIKFFIEGKNAGSLTEQKESKVKQIETIVTDKSVGDRKLKSLYEKYFSDEQEEFFKDNIKTMLDDVYKTESMIKKRTEAIYNKCITNFKIKSQTTEIKNPVLYMQGIINNCVADEIKKPCKERSYDLAEIEKRAINAAEIEEIEKQDVQAFTEPVKENNTTIPDKAETADSEPVGPSEDVLQDEEESYNEYFKTVREEIDLCLTMLEIVKTIPNYDNAVKFLDIFDIRWRNFELYCKEMITDELSKKQDAPEVVETT